MGCTAYIECQDTLFVERHAFFDYNFVTDDRLIDHHITGNMNIIPDVSVIQVYIVTYYRKKNKTELLTPVLLYSLHIIII